MNSIGKMGRGQWRYYQEEVARGREDYYAAGANRPGRWQGRGRYHLRLQGEVRADDVARVFNGLDPRHPYDDRPLVEDPRWRLPGYDLTFMAAKSVSVLWSLSDAETRRRIDQAVDRANDRMLAWLERKIAYGRTTNAEGQTVRVRGNGLTVATYAHSVSRNLDPHLHRHNLILNATERPNRRGELVMGALDGRLLYSYARPAGFVGQRLLRQELSRELGVRWTRELTLHSRSVESSPGVMEIEGLHDRQLLLAYSTRHEQVQEHLQAMGHSSPKAAEQAVLATRQSKPNAIDPAALEERWRATAARFKAGPKTAADALDHENESRLLSEADLAAAFDMLESPQGLTRSDSTFDSNDVLMALCEALPAGVVVDTDQLDESTHRFLSERAILVGRAGEDIERYTTAEMLATEAAGLLEALSIPGNEPARESQVAEALKWRLAGSRPLLAEQERALRAIAKSERSVQTLLGEAGTGKTSVIEVLREVREGQGRRVIGLALSARAAQQLREAHIEPLDLRTIASFRAWLESGAELPEGATVIVDEAGMVGTRDLARIQNQVLKRGGELILVGDHEQLPEIDAGGYFRSLHQRLAEADSGYRDSHELHQVLRQRDAQDVEALRALRSGDVRVALRSLDERGRIFEGKDAQVTERAMLVDWQRCHQAGRKTLMLARSRHRVASLNALAQALRRADGELGEGSVSAAGNQVFSQGDWIRFRQRNRELGIINGTQGTVRDVDPHHGAALVGYQASDGGDREAWLEQDWLQGVRRDGTEYVQLDYAATANLAQGSTTEVALAFVADDADRQWAYVAFSRHTEEVRVYVVAEPQWLEQSRDVMHGPIPEPEPSPRFAHISAAMSRDTKKHLASDSAGGDLQERLDELKDKRAILGSLATKDLRTAMQLNRRLYYESVQSEHDRWQAGRHNRRPERQPELFR